MKRIIYLSLLTLLISCNMGKGHTTEAISSLPSFNILLLDSTTIVNSSNIPAGKPTVFLFFKPDCHFCQEETRMLLKHIDSLQEVQLYFLTPMTFEDLKKYDNTFHLSNYKNITVGKDYEYSFSKVFKPTSVPYMVIYDRGKKLVKVYKDEAEINNILKAVRI